MLVSGGVRRGNRRCERGWRAPFRSSPNAFYGGYRGVKPVRQIGGPDAAPARPSGDVSSTVQIAEDCSALFSGDRTGRVAPYDSCQNRFDHRPFPRRSESMLRAKWKVRTAGLLVVAVAAI